MNWLKMIVVFSIVIIYFILSIYGLFVVKESYTPYSYFLNILVFFAFLILTIKTLYLLDKYLFELPLI